jgi:hypothetical protein
LGLDPKVPGWRLSWRVLNGELELMAYGEEGEHSDYISYKVILDGPEMKLTPPFKGFDKYREISAYQDKSALH